MIKTPLSIIAVLLLIAAVSSAEPVAKRISDFSNQFGLAGGLTSGTGLSYRRWIGDRFGLQVSGLYISSTEKYSVNTISSGSVDGYTTRWIHAAGILGLYSIRTWKRARTFAYLGTAFFSQGDIDHRSIMIDSVRYPYVPNPAGLSVGEQLAIGDGFGIEVFLWRFSFNLMAGMNYGFSFQEKRYIAPALSLEVGTFYSW